MGKEKGLPLGIARALKIKDVSSDKSKGVAEGSKADMLKDKKMLPTGKGKGRGRGMGRACGK